MSIIPIALFAYARPDHLKQTLEGLKRNQVPLIYAFCDGPKDESKKEAVTEVRSIIRSVDWAEIIITEREENWGLAYSIKTGVTEVLKKYDKIIVVEDDISFSSGFYQYMVDALNLYTYEEEVMHISAYMFPIKKQLPETLFYNVNSCWGWGTWKRAWDKYIDDTLFLYQKIEKLNKADMFYYNGGQGNAFFKQLEENLKGNIDTWAVKWHTSIYLNNGYCLHPGKSLVNNIGNDGSGTNSRSSSHHYNKELAENIEVIKIPIKKNKAIYKYINNYYRGNELKKNFKRYFHKSISEFRNFWSRIY
jgi:hypothetical protein